MAQGEKSTTDSPLKDQMEEQQHNSPSVETHATEDGVSKDDGHEAVEHGPVKRDQMDQALNKQDEPKQQDQNPEGNEGPSSQKSPSPDEADMSHYFESSNEDDISAQPGGSSIDPQSSNSKISAAAGIPESLLQGLNVSTPEEASTQTVKGLQHLLRTMKHLGSNKRI
jgi:hypothetical protein